MGRRPKRAQTPIGKRIQEIRESVVRLERGWSQERLAAQLGMDVRTFRRREVDGKLSLEEAQALANLVGCDVSWIQEGAGAGPAETGPERQIRDYVLAATELWRAHYGTARGGAASAAGGRLQQLVNLLRHAMHEAQKGSG